MTPQPKPRVGTKAKGGLAVGVIAILTAIFALEGGYVNDPADPGGETNHGITIGTARDHGYSGEMKDLPRWCPDALNVMIADAEAGRPVKLVKPCADTILFVSYLEKPGLLPLVEIDFAVADEISDTTTNMGPRRPARFFQQSINDLCGTTLTVDGKIGKITTAAWAQCRDYYGPPVCVRMLDRLDHYQRKEYERLIRRNASLRRFRRGWLNQRIGNVNRDLCRD